MLKLASVASVLILLAAVSLTTGSQQTVDSVGSPALAGDGDVLVGSTPLYCAKVPQKLAALVKGCQGAQAKSCSGVAAIVAGSTVFTVTIKGTTYSLTWNYPVGAITGCDPATPTFVAACTPVDTYTRAGTGMVRNKYPLKQCPDYKECPCVFVPVLGFLQNVPFVSNAVCEASSNCNKPTCGAAGYTGSKGCIGI